MTTPQPLSEPAAFADTLPRHVASACVLLLDDQDRVLMLHQARGYPGHPAWWQLPGGLSDLAEEPATTAKRELEEETGISLDGPLRPLAVDYRRADDGWPPVVDFCLTAPPVPSGRPVRLSTEHDAFAWRTFAEWQPYLQPLQRAWFESLTAAYRTGAVAILADGRPMA
ncbi:NUDIX hydrolase [Streptomyces sp. TLI_171]|uniref:NUDIX hydrolase n=1 Tax=Streptomyces sp. TLI_171 TaxID=1938859 RepID=UPI000C5BFAE2|nr:NUDIX hydrolase [Streptomyces sp. TLI_171]RKE05150.1 ADP-ribose pyrophosphatase YjhB (NUDIX family) [Streptomyces sp. TLI_171]